MGFDLGIALGSAGETALDTYTKLNREGRDVEKARREKEQFEWERREQQKRQALDQAALETYGKIGSQYYSQAIQEQGGAGSQQAKMLSDQTAGMGAENEGASAQSAVNAMRQNAGKEAITAALPSQTYTAEQAQKDYTQRLYALNPEKAQQSELSGLQLKNVKREAKLAEDFDAEKINFRDTLTKIHSIAETGGMKGLSEAANEEGLKTKFVAGKNGMGTIQVLGPKGDVIKTFNDVKSATEALANAAQMKFTQKLETMFGSAEKAADYYSKQKELGIKQQEADIHREFYGKGGTYERVNMAKVQQKENDFSSKLSPSVKYSLDQQKQSLAITQKGMEADPTNTKLQFDFSKQMLRYNQTLKNNGLDINVYDGTGIPAPEDAAKQILSNKNLKQKDIDLRIMAAKNISPDYANEVEKIINESKTEKSTTETKSAIPTEKSKTEVKIGFAPKQASEDQKNAFNQKQEANAKEANERKEKNQAIKVEKAEKEKEKVTKAQEVQKQRENDARTDQINRLEIKKEKALKKGDDATAKQIQENIARIKKQLQD